MLAKGVLYMKNLSKRDFSILIANIVDHFDTALYGFLAPVFANLFFPSNDPIVSLIMAYSVFATTIFTRPLGSYIFGLIALSKGPANSLAYSLIGVGITTFSLGILPTYQDIGFYAPTLLILLRSFCGVCSSGEMTIAKLYILDNNKDKKTSNRNSYLYQTSSMIGIVLASFASTIILNSHNQHHWRICFITGGIIALFGYLLRSQKFNKNQYEKLFKTYDSILITDSFKILWQNKVILLKIAIISGFSYITYSIPFIMMNNLVSNFTKFAVEDMMQSNTILLVLDLILLPVIGKFLATITARNTLITSAILLLTSSLPMWYFINDASFIYLMFIKLWIITIGVAFSCKINIWCNDQINGKQKYLITGIGSSLGCSIIGKMTPSICLILYHYFQSPNVVGLFITIISAFTLWALFSD